MFDCFLNILVQVFPDSLLLQLLQAMLHPDMEVRVGAHQMFSILLIPNSNRSRHEIRSLRSNSLYEPRKWQSSTESALVSVTARLEKLRKEKNGMISEKNNDELKEAYTFKNSTNFCKISTGFSQVQTNPLLISLVFFFHVLIFVVLNRFRNRMFYHLLRIKSRSCCPVFGYKRLPPTISPRTSKL